MILLLFTKNKNFIILFLSSTFCGVKDYKNLAVYESCFTSISMISYCAAYVIILTQKSSQSIRRSIRYYIMIAKSI